MHSKSTSPIGELDPAAEADDTIAAVADRAAAGWTAHEVEAAMAEAGFDLAHASDLINHVWMEVL